MNILFVGPYRQDDGWGHASREYIRALRYCGHNLAIRPVYLNQQKEYRDIEEFDSLENISYKKYDVIIQNVLPNLFKRYGGVKNIGISYFETTIKHTPWVRPINLMDKMWVTSNWEEKLLRDSGVTTDIDVIPIPTDLEKYRKEYFYPQVSSGREHEYKFYFIGEISQRKNLECLITAFNCEFGLNELVRLVLKLNMVGSDESIVLETAKQLIYSIKKKIGMYPDPSYYRSEIIIPTRLSEDELFGLHKECDCFVMPSSGEAFCLPAFDATMFGNETILNKNTGMSDFSTGYKLDSKKTVAIAADRPLPYLYNGRDMWYEVNINDLMVAMRSAFESGKAKDSVDLDSLSMVYSYEKVGKRMGLLLK